jgi:uncharacterized protein (DUF362 family)
MHRDEKQDPPRRGLKVKRPKALSRRKFIRLAVTGCGAAGMSGLAAACSPVGEDGGTLRNKNNGRNVQSRVVRLERPKLLPVAGPVSGETAQSMIDDLLEALSADDPSAGLGRLFRPGERIGIKLNCLAGSGLSPTPALVHALLKRLREAGHAPSNIVVFERSERELKRAGFEINHGPGVRFLGNDSRGMRYDPEPTCYESIGSCFARILTREIDALINFGVLKDHDLAGVSVGMKNLYGLIHNPNRYHDNNCSPYVAHVAASPPVRKKLRLTLCDGLTAQYKGGPALKKSCTWRAGILLASRDTVAIDAVGAQIIDQKRRAVGMKSLADSNQAPLYLEEARKIGLGENRLDRIKVAGI